MNLIEVLQAFSREVPDLLATSIVSRHDGTALASVSASPDLDAMGADAWFADMMTRSDLALSALGIQDRTEDVLISTRVALFVTRALPNTPYFWHVVTGKHTSLGLTRALMRKFEGAVVQRLP